MTELILNYNDTKQNITIDWPTITAEFQEIVNDAVEFIGVAAVPPVNAEQWMARQLIGIYDGEIISEPEIKRTGDVK
jgi:hypothetical protein